MADTTDRNRDAQASTTKKLDDLYKLTDGIDIAMFTTRRPDGQLVSRPMATQERVTGTDLWFVTNGPQSRVWDEAENRLHVQKAVMAALIGGEVLA